MTRKTMFGTGLVAAGALAATLLAGSAAQAAGSDERLNPGMQRMHELMQEGNPGMQRMHQLMQDGNPGMQRMHQLMQEGGGMHSGGMHSGGMHGGGMHMGGTAR